MDLILRKVDMAVADETVVGVEASGLWTPGGRRGEREGEMNVGREERT